MTLQEYVDEILLQLGDPIVTVEVKAYINKVVMMAFREIKRYINTTEYLTVPYSNRIDLSEYNVYTVVGVMRSQASNSSSVDFPDAFYLSMQRFPSGTWDMADYRMLLRISQLKNTVTQDLDYTYDNSHKYLYVNLTSPQATSITIVYIPDYKDVSEIKDPYWINLLKRLALALTKEMLGRVRGKYQLNSATYNLDADQLLAEAQSELAEIRGYLEENADIVFPID